MLVLPLPSGEPRRGIGANAEQASAVDTPDARLWQNLTEILSGIRHELPIPARPGLLVLRVTASYLDTVGGEIPFAEAGLIGEELRNKLPGIIQSRDDGPLTIVNRDKPEVGKLIISANFASDDLIRMLNNIIDEINISNHNTTKNPAKESGSMMAEVALALKESRRAWRASTEAMLRALPEDRRQLVEYITDINDEFRQTIAKRVEPSLNAYLHAADPREVEAKKRVADELRAQLAELNLVIRCPVTKKPSFLHVLPASEKNPHGRFEIRLKGLSRPTITRANLSDLLPLQLMDASPRREALAEWHRQVREQGGHTGGAAK